MKNSSYRTTKSSSKRPKYLLLALAGIVILVVVVAILEKTGHINLFPNGKTDAQTSPQTGINLNPPTKQDKQAAEQQKEAIVKQQESQQTSTPTTSTSTTPTNKKAVKPIIVSAAGGDLRSFVPGITENNGTCTARFVSGTRTATKTSQGVADAQNTVCTPINYSDTPAGPGWNVTVTYQSATSEGTSDANPVQ